MKRILFLACTAVFALQISSAAYARQTPKAHPVFEDGQAQIVEAFSNPDDWIREELWVETEFDSDGDGRNDRVHAAVTRQRQTETEGLKVPVIYGSSPYYSGTRGGLQYFWDINQELNEPSPPRTHQPPMEPRTRPYISNGFIGEWVPRGFAVVHSESPGTGLSEGCPTVGGINESLAPKAVIDWLNGRAKAYTSVDGDEEIVADWSTGKVGMTGTSYNGTLPLAAATTGVDGLEAIIPVSPNTSYWHYYRSYGLVRYPGGYPGEDVDVLYDFIHTRLDRADWCNAHVRDDLMANNEDRVTGDYNDFWAGRDYLNVIDKVKAATFMAHGFNDWNVMPEHSVRIAAALKKRGVPVMEYYHQGGHGGPPPMTLMNRWFTRYLYDIQNDVENDPRAWIVREGADRQQPTPYQDYPNPAAETVQVYLEAGGATQGALTLTDPANEGVESLTDDVSIDGETLARAQESGHRLLYVTPELKEDVHLSGASTITIRASSDKPAVNLSIWMVSLPWTDSQRNPRGGIITRGWADLQNHDSIRESAPLDPGQFYNMTFDLQPDDQIIKAGQRIGLMIFSSDHDFTLRPDPGTKLSVDLGGTSITVPVVGGKEALAKALGDESL
jgi:X-Pro dipeptidyl-peptidase